MISFHQMLLSDEIRMKAYRDAIHATVRKGDAVLDVGTGTGILAFFACQAGADRVYAVEKEDTLSLARQLARDNGWSEKITFINGDARFVTLPEPVDVITSELISKDIIGQKMELLTSITRKRFLEPHGTIIPKQITFFVAPIELPEMYKQTEFPQKAAYGVDFSLLRQYVTNEMYSARAGADSLLAEGKAIYRFDSLSVKDDDIPQGRADFVIQRKGRLHGFCCWFTALLSPSVSLSNFPPGIHSWDNHIFPVTEPVPVDPGMVVEFHLHCQQKREAVYHWTTSVKGAAMIGRSPTLIAHFRQSSELAIPRSLSKLRKWAYNHKPVLNEEGNVNHYILSLMDGARPLEEIAEQVASKFPSRFASWKDAILAITDFSNSYD